MPDYPWIPLSSLSPAEERLGDLSIPALDEGLGDR